MQRTLVRTIVLVAALAACADRSTAPVMSDAASQSRAACELTIPIADARLRLVSIGLYVSGLESGGVLTTSQARSLRSRLDRASSELDAGRICQALNTVEGFEKQVRSYLSRGDLTYDQASPLIEGAQIILGVPVAGPQITITSPADNSIIGQFTVFTYEIQSTAAMYECSIDGSTVLCGPTSMETVGLATGLHTFTIHAMTAGGAESFASIDFEVDASAPTVVSLDAVESSPGTAHLSYFVTDRSPIQAVMCRIDGGIFVLCGQSASGAYDFPGLTAGEHVIEVMAFDIWGNSGNTVESSPPPAAFARVTVTTTGLYQGAAH